MLKLIFASLIFCLSYNILNGQQVQIIEDPFFYKISGLVYVYEFDAITRMRNTNLKIPKEPLKFKIVAKEIDAGDGFTFYVIKFLTIEEESGILSTLKSNANFVNSQDNNKFFWLRKDELDNYMTNGFITKSYKTPNVSLAYGANISLPFKLRPETDGQNIKITPDLTLGGFLGSKWRISSTKPFYMTAPIVSIGLATLSVNDNNSTSTPSKGDGTVMGITGSIGVIFQLNDFQFGLMMGWDRAAGEYGKEWIYNDKTWYSFSIGYTFLGNNAEPDKNN